MNDERRTTARKAVHAPVEVTDAIGGGVIGHVGNLSRNGMLLIGTQPLHDNALYQLRFRLPDAGHTNNSEIEIGVHTMWTAKAATSGYRWAGLRIISVSATAAKALDRWLTARNH